MQPWIGGSALVFLTVACGASVDGSDPGSAGVEGGELTLGSSPVDIGARVEKVRQSLGEATCASTPADHVMDVTVEGYVTSPTTTYDHSTCRNGYVVDLKSVTAGHSLNSATYLQPSDPFTCLFVWSYIALYQLQGTSYVKVGENVAGGSWGLGRFGGACSANSNLTIPAAGEYKVVVSAGNLFGGRYPVRLTYL